MTTINKPQTTFTKTIVGKSCTVRITVHLFNAIALLPPTIQGGSPVPDYFHAINIVVPGSQPYTITTPTLVFKKAFADSLALAQLFADKQPNVSMEIKQPMVTILLAQGFKEDISNPGASILLN